MTDAPVIVKVKPLVWEPAPHGYGYPYEWQAWCDLMGGYYLAASEGAKREHEAVRAARILAELDMTPDPRVTALVEALDGIRSSWADGIVTSDAQHTLILEDGSRHTGPAVDFLARLAAAQIDLIEAALAALKGDGND